MENQNKDANSIAYNLPIHESSSSKISSPSGGEKRSSRDNSKVTSAIFNQTLDHHQEFSKQGAGSVDQRSPDPDHHHHHSTTTALAIASTSASYPGATTTSTSLVHYKECLRNHAANKGGHVLDGCGEFMPGGEEGTPEALKCAACDCHRNFHRKEINNNNNNNNNGFLSQQQPSTVANNCYVYSNNNNNKSSQRNRVVSHHHHHHHQPQYPSLLAPPTTQQPQQQQHRLTHFMSTTTTSPQRAPMTVTFGGGGGGAPAEYSSSEDLNNNMYQSNAEIMQGREQFEFGMSSKKRFRTKFSQEQKDKMHEFAEKLGWKMQKQDDDEVQQFCSQVGVKRQVFKVWMHNNKQAMKKKQP